MPSQRPFFSSDPSLRRLGVGGGGGSGRGGGGGRTLRAQVVIAFMLVLMLLAVPLYLWRRPSTLPAGPEAREASDAGILRPDAGGVVRSKLPLPKQEQERVRLGPVQRVKCSRSSRERGSEGSLCEPLPSLEAALHKAIEANVDCAPKNDTEGTINYVLTLDFTSKAVAMFPGASGTWHGKQAKRATTCVLRSLPPVPWDTVPHQYRYYTIAILATYPAATPVHTVTVFE